jgi:glycerophosphoryl diester phosphodiesterase
MLTIAHRGAHTAAPENTLEAFKAAIALGMDGVELDVHLAATGEVVVLHDDTVNRTTNGRGKVAEIGWDALKILRVGGSRIPRLEEALEVIGTDRYCFVEVKAGAAAVPAARIIHQQVAKGWDASKLFLISFQHAALLEALQAVPQTAIGASFEVLAEDSIEHAAIWGATAVLPHYRASTLARVAEAHRLGLKVIPWTVNSLHRMAILEKAGVDGIISDYPQRLKYVFG